MNRIKYFAVTLALLVIVSCGPGEIVPVELYAEDECAACRMAISSPEFASEIIKKDGSAAKFDDLKCFEKYRREQNAGEFEAMFVKNYETKGWIPFDKSIIIQTGIETPMGSGKIAVADQERAKEILKQHPVKEVAAGGDPCCAGTKE